MAVADREVLRIGPLDPTQPVEPGDADVAGKLVGHLGVHHQANQIIRAVGTLNPPGLVTAGALPTDGDRTVAVRENLSEVESAADTKDPIESALVKGTGEDRLVVVYVARAKSGRSYRGMVPYSAKSFRKTEAGAALRRDARLGVLQTADAVAGRQKDDPVTDELRLRVQELEARLAEATAAAEQPAEDGEAPDREPAAEQPAEPEPKPRRSRGPSSS